MTTSWRRLCGHLSDDAGVWEALSDEVAGDESTEPEVIWQSLIEGLDDSGDLAFLDRGDSGAELATALESLPRLQGTDLDLDLIGDIEGSLSQAIIRADEVLAGDGHLPDAEDPEAYPLVAVRIEAFDDVQQLLTLLT